MVRRAALRASDADRELVTEQLKRASTEGRLAPEELEQRLERTLSARTYGELDAVMADLPSSPRALRARGRRSSREPARLQPALVAAIAVPVVLAVTVLALLAITGVFAAWVLWAAAGWWFFSRRRRRWARYTGQRACGHPRASRVGFESSRGTWV